MALRDVENAMRVEAAAWAQTNGVQFHWQNTEAKNPHSGESVAWRFVPSTQDRLTSMLVQHTGSVEARVYVPAGLGVIRALQLAESIESLFRGRVYAGSTVQDEIAIVKVGREGSSYRIDVRIPWEFDERRVPKGVVGLHQTPGAVIAYQAFRQRWESLVRAPLALKSFFDNSPPEEDAPPPWAYVTFRTLQPVRVEVQTLSVPGRVIAALNFPLGDGVANCETAITTIVHAFDECSFRGVRFTTPSVVRVGRTPLETWQANVRLPFAYEVHT
jgi:hypothetical protein